MRPFPKSEGLWQVSTSGGIQPRWRHDGKELYYIAPDGKLMAAAIAVNGATLEPGTPVALFHARIWGGTDTTTKQQYDVASDARLLINLPTEDATSSPHHASAELDSKP